ncbi:MAG TPA: extracellular solute-binding protein [Clostridiaceae bacterium]|nr:extracellular solute-binding protein [Clostridiaceae bacterium]
MKRILAIALALAVSAGILVSCESPVGPAESTPPVVAPEPVEIRFIGQFGGTDPTTPIFDEILKKFTDTYPYITVVNESNTADESWKARVTTDFSSGNDPDVVQYFNGPDARILIENNKVVAIEEIKKIYPDYAGNISDEAMSYMKEYDGKHYGVPVRGFYEGLFCNRDLFEKYGLDLPTDWEKLETAITRFAEEGVVPIAASFSDVPHYLIEHFILAEGGIEDHSINPKVTYPESWAKGISYFKKFKDMGAFPVDVNATKNDIAANLFYNKQAAMIVEGSWSIGSIKYPDTTVILPFPPTPEGKKDPTDIIGGFTVGFYISTKAWNNPAKRDAAVLLVKALTSNESIAAYAKVGGIPAADIGPVAGHNRVMIMGLDMSKIAKGLAMPIDSRLSKEAWTYFVSQIGSLADGQITPEALLNEVVKKNK